jgi:DNA-binding CsgD family transcriptional regulator
MIRSSQDFEASAEFVREVRCGLLRLSAICGARLNPPQKIDCRWRFLVVMSPASHLYGDPYTPVTFRSGAVMSKSEALRDSHVRAMLRLMGEMCELPPDPSLRSRHMLEGLCRITNARVGTVTAARHEYDRRGKRKIHLFDGHAVGVDAHGERVVAEYLKTLEPADPLSEPLYSTPGPLIVRAREQLLEAGLWHRSAHFNEVRRGFGVDDCIAAKVTLTPSPSRVQTVCVHRALREGRFNRRYLKMMELFLGEARRFIRPASIPAAQMPGGKPLSPRLQEVLERLLHGDSAKQVARRLGLSTHTVNEYIQQLHQRFNVSSRGELLALFVHGNTP